MKKALLVLNMQKAYMNEETMQLIGPIEEYCANTYYDLIVVGKFVNETSSVFVRQLGDTSCLNVQDQALTISISRSYEVMERTAYTMYTEQLEQCLQAHQIKYVYLCGLDTDRSIYKTALDLFERGYYVYVLKNLCASSIGISYHEKGIELLKRQIGSDYVI